MQLIYRAISVDFESMKSSQSVRYNIKQSIKKETDFRVVDIDKGHVEPRRLAGELDWYMGVLSEFLEKKPSYVSKLAAFVFQGLVSDSNGEIVEESVEQAIKIFPDEIKEFCSARVVSAYEKKHQFV